MPVNLGRSQSLCCHADPFVAIVQVELNSDSPDVLIDFLTTAISNCVARQSTEYFLLLSSHGGGPFGFGGDDHTVRRRLIENNQDVAYAIRTALSQTPGAPSMLDVLAFDACLMQSDGALDDYSSITKYYLASEDVIPAHGKWQLRS